MCVSLGALDLLWISLETVKYLHFISLNTFQNQSTSPILMFLIYYGYWLASYCPTAEWRVVVVSVCPHNSSRSCAHSHIGWKISYKPACQASITQLPLSRYRLLFSSISSHITKQRRPGAGGRFLISFKLTYAISKS